MAKQLYPEGKYKITNIGPQSPWQYDGKTMIKYTIQLDGIAPWVELNQAEKTAAPEVGQELEGHVEQDDAGKYPPKFKKVSKGGGGFGGGNAATPGAIWSATFATAAEIVAGFLAGASDEKRKKASESVDQYLQLVELVAVKLKAKVDLHAGTPAPAATSEPQKAESESGESPAAGTPGEVEIEDLDEKDLGEDW